MNDELLGQATTPIKYSFYTTRMMFMNFIYNGISDYIARFLVSIPLDRTVGIMGKMLGRQGEVRIDSLKLMITAIGTKD